MFIIINSKKKKKRKIIIIKDDEKQIYRGHHTILLSNTNSMFKIKIYGIKNLVKIIAVSIYF